MLVELLCQTILTEAMLLAHLILKDHLGTAINLYIPNPHKEPICAHQIHNTPPFEFNPNPRLVLLKYNNPDQIPQQILYANPRSLSLLLLRRHILKPHQLIQLQIRIIKVEQPHILDNVVMGRHEHIELFEAYRPLLDVGLFHDLLLDGHQLEVLIVIDEAVELALGQAVRTAEEHVGEDHLTEELFGHEHYDGEAADELLRSHVAAAGEVEEVEEQPLRVLG